MRTPAPRTLAVACGLAFLVSLPFHRPALTLVFGPAVGLPELLFLPAVVSLTAVLRGECLRAPSLLALSLIAGFAPSVIDAVHPGAAATQLLVLLYAVAGIYAVGAMLVALGQREEALRALVVGALVASFLGTLFAFIDWMGGDPRGLARHYPLMTWARPVGPTESPNMLALLAVGAWIAARFLRRQGGLGRGAFAVLSIVFGVTVVAAQSRMALAGVAGLGTLQALGSPRRPVKIAGLGLILFAVIMVVASVAWRIIPVTAQWPYLDSRPSMYWVCHDIAWRAFRSEPLTGVGLECFRDVWATHYEPGRHDVAFSGGAEGYIGVPRDPHGTLHGYLAEAGLPAVGVLLALALLVWRRRDEDAPELVAFLVVLLVASATTDVLTKRSAWALIALLSMSPRPRGPPQAAGGSRASEGTSAGRAQGDRL